MASILIMLPYHNIYVKKCYCILHVASVLRVHAFFCLRSIHVLSARFVYVRTKSIEKKTPLAGHTDQGSLMMVLLSLGY